MTRMAKWTKLGTLRSRKTKSGGDQRYIVLDKNYEIVDKKTGEKVDLGQYNQIKMFKSEEGLKASFERGNIDEEKFNKDMNFIQEKGVLYDLTVVQEEN